MTPYLVPLDGKTDNIVVAQPLILPKNLDLAWAVDLQEATQTFPPNQAVHEARLWLPFAPSLEIILTLSNAVQNCIFHKVSVGGIGFTGAFSTACDSFDAIQELFALAARLTRQEFSFCAKHDPQFRIVNALKEQPSRIIMNENNNSILHDAPFCLHIEMGAVSSFRQHSHEQALLEMCQSPRMKGARLVLQIYEDNRYDNEKYAESLLQFLTRFVTTACLTSLEVRGGNAVEYRYDVERVARTPQIQALRQALRQNMTLLRFASPYSMSLGPIRRWMRRNHLLHDVADAAGRTTTTPLTWYIKTAVTVLDDERETALFGLLRVYYAAARTTTTTMTTQDLNA